MRTLTVPELIKIILLLPAQIVCEFGSCGTLGISTSDNMINWLKHTPPIVLPTDSCIKIHREMIKLHAFVQLQITLKLRSTNGYLTYANDQVAIHEMRRPRAADPLSLP